VPLHGLLHDPHILGQNLLEWPRANPFGRRPASHVAVPESLRRNMVIEAPLNRTVHPGIVDSLINWLLVFPRVPARGREIKSIADQLFPLWTQMVVTADHAAKEKLLSRRAQTRDAIASAGQRYLLTSMQAGGERGISGADVGHRLRRVLQI